MAVFGVFELPALLVLCFGAIRVTYGQVKSGWPEDKHCDAVTVHLIAETITKWLTDEYTGQAMIQVMGGREQEGRRFYHGTVKWNIFCHIDEQEMSQLSAIAALQMWMRAPKREHNACDPADAVTPPWWLMRSWREVMQEAAIHHICHPLRWTRNQGRK